MRHFSSMFDINAHTNHTDSHPSGQHNFILFLIAGLFKIGEELSADSIYQWIFRILSLISVMIVIYINWDKAKQTYLKKKQLKKNKHGKD